MNNIRNNGKMTTDDEKNFVMNGRAGGGSKWVPFALGAIIGGAIGAAIGMLLAPAEGSSLRREISDKLDDVAYGAKDIIKGVRTAAEKLFSDDPDDDAEEDTVAARTREKADDIIEDADRAIAEARRRSEENAGKWDDDEDEEA